MENIKKVIEKIEELGWSVDKDDTQYILGLYSPAGQDFSIYVESDDDVDTFIGNIYERYENFDVSEETYQWLDNFGHGVNGAPHDMRDLYNDFEWCEQQILELHDELEKHL